MRVITLAQSLPPIHLHVTQEYLTTHVHIYFKQFLKVSALQLY